MFIGQLEMNEGEKGERVERGIGSKEGNVSTEGGHSEL